MKLIGYKETSFTAKDTGDKIEGINLFVTYKDDKVQGQACERLFVTKHKCGDYKPVVGQEITVDYNRYGKVESVRALP